MSLMIEGKEPFEIIHHSGQKWRLNSGDGLCQGSRQSRGRCRAKKAVREAVAESAAAVADYKAGSERALNFIVGQVMKKTRGKADAGEVHRLVKAEVEKA
jgi:Asp-tRNA(Asn)/Glu-tRNA(Gln) amidotransferase B subunit